MHIYRNLAPPVQKYLIFRCVCLSVILASITYNSIMIGLINAGHPDLSNNGGFFYITLLIANGLSLIINLMVVWGLIYHNKNDFSTTMFVLEVSLGVIYVIITSIYLEYLFQPSGSFVAYEFAIVEIHIVIYYGLMVALLLLGLKTLCVAMYQRISNCLKVIRAREEEQQKTQQSVA